MQAVSARCARDAQVLRRELVSRCASLRKWHRTCRRLRTTPVSAGVPAPSATRRVPAARVRGGRVDAGTRRLTRAWRAAPRWPRPGPRRATGRRRGRRPGARRGSRRGATAPCLAAQPAQRVAEHVEAGVGAADHDRVGLQGPQGAAEAALGEVRRRAAGRAGRRGAGRARAPGRGPPRRRAASPSRAAARPRGGWRRRRGGGRACSQPVAQRHACSSSASPFGRCARPCSSAGSRTSATVRSTERTARLSSSSRSAAASSKRSKAASRRAGEAGPRPRWRATSTALEMLLGLAQRLAQRLDLVELVEAVVAGRAARVRVAEAALPAAQGAGADAEHLCGCVDPDPAHRSALDSQRGCDGCAGSSRFCSRYKVLSSRPLRILQRARAGCSGLRADGDAPAALAA